MDSTLLKLVFSFKSRLSRGPFWWLCIALWTAFSILFVFLDKSLGRGATWVLYPFLFWILAALMVKRLHDRGSRAWQLLWVLLPVLGPAWLIINMALRKGTEGDNQYGPDPLVVDVDYLRVDTP